MIKTYIKKPLAVQAVQWTGDNTDEVVDFGTNCRSRNANDKRNIRSGRSKGKKKSRLKKSLKS